MAKEEELNENQSSVKKDDSIYNAVGSSIQGVQSTFGAIFSQFEQSFQQTLDMGKGMAHMMEQVYKAGIKISSELKPLGNGKIHMSLLIINETKAPAHSMTGTMEFETDEEDKIDISYLGAYQNYDKTQPLQNLFESPCNLMPQARYTQDIEIHIIDIKRRNGIITLSIPNPLSPQETIKVHHRFGLYLIDQFKKEILDDKLDLQMVDRLCYPVAFLRDIFEIHPIIGITSGMCVALSTSKYKIVCEFVDINQDYTLLEVEFTSNNQEIALKLIEELSILCVV